MTKSPEKLQAILDTIQKMATPYSGPSTSTPSPGHLYGPSMNQPSSGGGRADPSIAKMQVAIEELSAKIGSSSMPVNMPANLVAELAKISHPVKGQKFADGSWGPHTDSALHHIVDLAKYLSALSDKFKLNTESIFPKERINLFETLLSGYQVEPHRITLSINGEEGQIARAPYITERIEATSRLYDYILSQVPAISNEKILNHNERRYLQSGSTSVTLESGQQFSIPLSALVSMKRYDDWIKSQKLDNDKMKILDLIINKQNAARPL